MDKTQATWEDSITLGTHSDMLKDFLGPIKEHLALDDKTVDWGRSELPLEVAICNDSFPLPKTEHREGYWGNNHFNYWASGLQDCINVYKCAQKYSVAIRDYFDIGCATGRVLRHFALQHDGITTIGADINRLHVDWCNRFLPKSAVCFQNHSIPMLPLPDSSMDFITAFSVFTHVECFDTAWLMEIRRILRPGGLAWVTVHTEETWRALKPSWPLHKGLQNHPKYRELQGCHELPEERLVFRYHANRSYSSNVFYSIDYLQRVWGRILNILEGSSAESVGSLRFWQVAKCMIQGDFHHFKVSETVCFT